MAIQFVVENGSGLVDANSYVTVAEADQYLENSGRKVGQWADGGNGGKQAALVAAFVYMFARWSPEWLGIAAWEDQSGDWPRDGVVKRSGFLYANNEIPLSVKNAQIEYAFVHTNEGGLILNPVYDETNRPVTMKLEKVDVLTEQTQYSDKINPQTYRAYPVADGLLRNLVAGGSVSELVRN